MVLLLLKVTASPPMWEMHFGEAAEAVLLETVDTHDDDLAGGIKKERIFIAPKRVRDRGKQNATYARLRI